MLRHPSHSSIAPQCHRHCQWRLLGTSHSHNPNPSSLCSFVLVLSVALPSFCALFMFLVLLRPCPCSFTCAHFMFVLSLCCSLCSLPVYYGRYSCSFVRFMQARGRSLQIAVARSDGQIFHADALCPVLIRPHSFSKVLRKPFAGSSDAAARVASPACAPASSSAPTTAPSTATAASSRRPATVLRRRPDRTWAN